MGSKRFREDLFFGLLFFTFYLLLGIYLCLERNYLPYDALGRLVSAWLVLNGTEMKLASIGFVWPPIPTLLVIPFTAIPALVTSWVAMVIVSALFMALAGVMVGQIATLCGIGNGYRRVIMTLFTVNPLMIAFGANGMSEAILIACLTLACYYLIRFWRSDRNTDLIFTAGFFGLLPLIRYEFAVLSAWSGVLMVFLAWRNAHKFSVEEFRNYLEGRLLAYASLAVYPLFLWAIANWFIMGNPLYFLINDRSAVSLTEMQLSAYTTLVTTPFMSFRLVFGVWILIFILGAAAFLAVFFNGLLLRRSGFLLGMSGLWLMMPLVQMILLIQRSNVPLLRYFVMSVPLGVVLALVAAADMLGRMKGRRWAPHVVMGGFILLFVLSNFGSLKQLNEYPYQNMELDTWRALTTSEKISNVNIEDAYAVGRRLVEVIPPGSRVLIDTYHFGFAIELGAGTHDIFLDFTDPNYDAAVKNPPAHVDYVIVPTTYQRGALYVINMVHKKLHSEGATWAEPMNVLPSTYLEWKLFKVKR